MADSNGVGGRQAALRDGVLVDVSDIAEGIGISYPVAVSTSVYNFPGFSAGLRTEHLRTILSLLLSNDRFLLGQNVGEKAMNIVVIDGKWAIAVDVRAVVERNPVGGGGVIATIYTKGESPALQGSAASLFRQ